MNRKPTAISRRTFASVVAGALVVAATLTGSGFLPRPASAHDTNCPYCKMKVTQDTKDQDNEVALRYGRKRIEYKCVWCAIADTNNGTYKDSDVTILAPSEKKSQPVEIMRMGGKWMAPKDTVFVGVKASHRVCQETYRAFTNKAAFDAYVAKNPAVKDATPLTLDQMIASAKNAK